MGFRKLSDLVESLETAHKLKFVEQTTDEYIDFIMNNKNYTLYSGKTINDLKGNRKIFDEVQKYIITYEGETIGTIIFADAVKLFRSPFVTGVLYVTDFELDQNIKRKFRNLSPLEFSQSILDWLVEYCKENNYHHILVNAKDERVYKLYTYAGFNDVQYWNNDLPIQKHDLIYKVKMHRVTEK